MALWGSTIAESRQLRAHATTLDWSQAGVATSSLAVAAWLESAIALFYSFKVAGIVSTGLLTLRVFWLFSLQPQLAILSLSIYRSMSDLAHFGFVFAVVLVFFGMWGYTMFGTQVRQLCCGRSQ